GFLTSWKSASQACPSEGSPHAESGVSTLVSLPPTARFNVSHASADGHRGSEGRRRWTGSSAASAGIGKGEIGRSSGTRAHPVKNCLLFIFFNSAGLSFYLQ